MIKVHNISFSYDKTPIIADISLSIPTGEWLGLVGPNGAGKTTLLKLISGYLRPASGDVELNKINVSDYSRNEMARLIAVVPQSSSYTFSFSAFDIVLMGRSPYIGAFSFESSEDVKIAEDAMRRTDTWQFKDRTMDELSGGERQRVLIARALAQAPKILLLDEPTTFLDIKHQMDIMKILSELNREGLTIVSAIHDVNLAISYCKKIALLGSGLIFAYGEPAEVITYKNLTELFNAEVYVGTNEFSGKPYYVPMVK